MRIGGGLRRATSPLGDFLPRVRELPLYRFLRRYGCSFKRQLGTPFYVARVPIHLVFLHGRPLSCTSHFNVFREEFSPEAQLHYVDWFNRTKPENKDEWHRPEKYPGAVELKRLILENTHLKHYVPITRTFYDADPDEPREIGVFSRDPLDLYIDKYDRYWS